MTIAQVLQQGKQIIEAKYNNSLLYTLHKNRPCSIDFWPARKNCLCQQRQYNPATFEYILTSSLRDATVSSCLL